MSSANESMSNETYEQLPNVPEGQIIEPIFQCGVLYLGTAPPLPNHRGLESIQDPFSQRYPIDGTNTVQGIDSILSIYKNGLQLTFARQPYAATFFPLSCLIYCASLRFSIIENDSDASLDWRFISLDPNEKHPTRHPPLFALVTQRTKIVLGDECHCFVAKNLGDALRLVRTVSEVYANFQPSQPTSSSIRSPIFYQLDRYHRKLGETNGLIYFSPIRKNEQSNETARLLPDEYFYRTDGVSIEQWQLWDDEDSSGTRPRPPNSPFGQHQGLYHDDLIEELNEHLRCMDEEDDNETYSQSSTRHHRKSRRKSSLHRVQSCLQSSFDPTSIVAQQSPSLPIIIEKVLPQAKALPAISYPNTEVVIEPERVDRMNLIPVKRSHKKRPKKHRIPVVDIQSIERLFPDKQPDDQLLTRSDLVQILEGYFEDHRGEKIRFEGDEAEKFLEELHSQAKKEKKQSTSTSERTVNYVN